MGTHVERSFATLALAAALGGCSGTPAPQPALTYYRDVKAIIDTKCVKCHSASGIAPMPLGAHEDFTKDYLGLVKEKVASHEMPPWPPGKGCTDYVADRSLSEAQIATITKWVDLGGPAGSPADYVKPAETPEPGLSRADLTIGLPGPWVPTQAPDEYRCFLIDWPEQTTRYVTGFRANPGNGKIVHHVIAFLAGPQQAAGYQQLDDGEPGPGYTCFGGPGGGPTSWLGGWAPGSAGGDFPPGTGLKALPGSKVILQVHYNFEAGHAPAPDRTTVDLKLESQVTKEAYILPWADIAWVRDRMMRIPAGDADVMHNFTFDPSPYFSLITGGTLKDNVPTTFHSASLHMHTRGKSGFIEFRRQDMSKECLLDIHHWDFHWQGSYGFAKTKQLAPGDKIHLECHWDNSAANQPWVGDKQVAPQDLNWGEGTNDEMCLGGFYLTQ